jgi:hypothetical protein
MLRAKDSAKFVCHQRDEIRGLQGARVFAYKKRSTLPKGASILNLIWSYQRKRRPDGTLLKLKTRICADGSMQEQGYDVTDSYAPVVQWSSVHLCLILAIMLGIPAQEIDFTQAFCNTDINEDVYISIPQGWYYCVITAQLEQHNDPRFRDHAFCMQRVKNLYGTKQAARNWYLLVSETLTSEHHSFKASQIDPCLFIRDDCIVLVYTNDCIILGRDQTAIDKIKTTLTEVKGFLHRTKGTLNNFLGVRINMHNTATGD